MVEQCYEEESIGHPLRAPCSFSWNLSLVALGREHTCFSHIPYLVLLHYGIT